MQTVNVHVHGGRNAYSWLTRNDYITEDGTQGTEGKASEPQLYADITLPSAGSEISVSSSGVSCDVSASLNGTGKGVYFGFPAQVGLRINGGSIATLCDKPASPSTWSGGTYQGSATISGPNTGSTATIDVLFKSGDVNCGCVGSKAWRIRYSWTFTVSHTLTYDANGGTGAPGAEQVSTGVAHTLSSVVPTRTNYDFDGWFSWNTGQIYQPGGTFVSNATSDETIYAVWTARSTLHIIRQRFAEATRYERAGTVLDLTGYQEVGDLVTATFNNNFSGGGQSQQQDYRPFKSWALDAGSKGTLSGASYTFSDTAGANDYVRAQYNPITITFPSPTRSQYLLAGWATSSTGGAVYSPGQQITIYDNTTFYAVWVTSPIWERKNGQWVRHLPSSATPDNVNLIYKRQGGSWSKSAKIYIRQNGQWIQLKGDTTQR